MDFLALALILVLVGAGLWIAAKWAMRFAPANQVADLPEIYKLEVGQSSEDEGILIIEQGGKVAAFNPALREIFQLKENDQPNLEELVGRIRPADQFLSLCGVAGKSTLSIEGRLVEAGSYQLQLASGPVMVVRLVQKEPEHQSQDNHLVPQADSLRTISELGQNITSSLDLEATLISIHASVQKLIPAGYVEITVWDEETKTLVPHRFLGEPGSAAKLAPPRQGYALEDGYSGLLARSRQPLLVLDVESRLDIQPAVDRGTFPIRSYAGVPLYLGDDLVGTLEIGSLDIAAFQQKELASLELIAGQAATAIHNALRFQAEKKRTAELSGLAMLTQSFSSVRDPKSLFSRLLEAISPLIPAEILGFLLYNDLNRTLEGQEPFLGLPSQIVQLLRIPIPSGSPAEQILLEQDVVISENAAESPEWETLGLSFLAQAASLRETALIPLVSGGKMLGYLQASNHKDGSREFSQDELRLLTIVSNQAAPIIENVTLVMQARQRAQRSEALRRITSLASSAATLDEILQFSVREIQQLIQADLGAVLLVDPAVGSLKVHQPSFTSTFPLEGMQEIALPLDDPQYPFTVTERQHAWMSNNLVDEKLVIPFYQNIVMRWQIVSILVVPLIVRDRGLGELWFGSAQQNAFDQGEVQMISTAAGQLAGVVEQGTLRVQTDESLQRRVEQLTALTRISRELSTSLNLSSLMSLVHSEALRTSRADCGTLVLYEMDRPDGEPLRIRTFLGDTPRAEPELHDVEVLTKGEAVYIPDLAKSTIKPVHDHVASLVLVPVKFQGKPAGLITLHGRNINQFDPDSIQVVQSLADQAGVVIGNAQQYEQQFNRSRILKRELDTVAELFKLAPLLTPSHSLGDVLNSIARAIQSATPFQVVVLSMYDPSGNLRRVACTGLPEEDWQEMLNHQQPWNSVQQLLQPRYRKGNGYCYYIPANETLEVPQDVHTHTLNLPIDTRDQGAWHPDDMLLLPLFGANQQPLGLISLDAPSDQRRPDRSTLDALELFATQAAVMIENRQKVADLELKVADITAQQKKIVQSAENTQRNLPALLRKDLENTLVIDRLSAQLQRAYASLEISDQANRQNEPRAVLRSLAEQIMARFDMHLAIIAEKVENTERLLEVLGSAPGSANPDSLIGQRNPLHQVLQDRKVLLVDNLESDRDWRSNAFLRSMEARSMIGLPVAMGEGRMAAVLVLGRNTLPAFDSQDSQIFAQLARQVSVGVHNLNLLTETRSRLQEVNLLLDFTRKMDVLDSNSILRSLGEAALQAIPAAQAGWVAVWDERSQALLPRAAYGYRENESILGIAFKKSSEPGDQGRDSLPVRVLLDGKTENTEVKFAQDYNLPAADLLLYRHATGGKLPVSSLLVPLRRGDLTLGILVLDNFSLSDAFSQEDAALASSLAQQTALALDSARLFAAAGERAAQLQALTQASGAMTGSLQHTQLESSLLGLLKNVLPFDTATLWLREGQNLRVVAAEGFQDSKSLLGIIVSVQDSALFQQMASDARPLMVPDTRLDDRFLKLQEVENLCWLGIPLLSKSALAGLIALEKREPGFYTPEHMQAAATFASQAAVALENARLFEESTQRTAELDERSQRLALLNRLSTELGGSLDVPRILNVTASTLADALHADRVFGIITDDSRGHRLMVEVPALTVQLPLNLQKLPILERLEESQGVYTAAQAAREDELAGLNAQYPLLAGGILLVPLVTAARLAGWMAVQKETAYRFSSAEVELARTITNQAAVAVQTATLYLETRRLTEDLERRVEERTVELRREHNNTETLLKIITELSNSLDLEQVMARALHVLTQSLDAERAFIYLQSGGRIFQAGEAVRGGDTLEREIAAWIVRHKVPTVVEDLMVDSRWQIPKESAEQFHSLLAVPLVLGEEVLGSLLLLHHLPGRFFLEQTGLVEATARQFSITLNNAELFTLIRDQAQNLGGLLRDQQVEASRSQAILESVADGVLVTDQDNRITLLNASAERILGVKAQSFVNRPLGELVGIFGKAASKWQQTIQKWTTDPASFEGVSYAERLELENGTIVSVTLAPVFFRNGFLATVSIFRDITHETRVERLKSEFIANVSHELRTPLTSIKGYVEVMLMGVTGALSSQQEQFFKIIRSNTERLNTLINDLLDVSKIESGVLQLDMKRVDLVEMASELLLEFQRRSNDENRPMNFGLDTEQELSAVHGDPQRVRQVLAALISNGYLYTPENGHVTVKLRKADDMVRVDVEDDGIGLSERDRPRLFERFYRGDDPLVLASSGTGLGLAIARIMVQMHGGKIWFDSRGVRGEGSTFSFTLPAYIGEG